MDRNIGMRLPNTKVGIRMDIMGADEYKWPAPTVLRNPDWSVTPTCDSDSATVYYVQWAHGLVVCQESDGTAEGANGLTLMR